jgi:hypothetical protein
MLRALLEVTLLAFGLLLIGVVLVAIPNGWL